MEKKSPIKLTSAEISTLWTSYMNDSLSTQMCTCFLNHVEDTDIKELLVYTLELSQKHMQRVQQILTDENHPIPQGITADDVDLSAPRLYSDAFYLYYLQGMARIGLNANSTSLPLMARDDVRDFIVECINSSNELTTKTTKILLDKGLFIRSPYIPVPGKLDYVHKQSFLTGWFGNRRSLLAIEATHLFSNIQTNVLGKMLLTGFSQVAQRTDVKNFILRGKEMASKHIEIFSSILNEDDLPTSVTWDATVTRSSVPPFSDKLIMYHTVNLIVTGIGNYGLSLSASPRRDLASHYARLTTEVGQYCEDGTNIMIDYKWLEEAPQVPDRQAIANQ